ncbi:MAG: hypothetical protein M9933_01210 [Chitinophagaceae bacterium]|nr:hypothetical protein [Chitinophagaceae bacterium]
MKIAQLLGQYLLQNKKMQLEGIGEFVLDNFYENPFEHEKGKIRLPDNAIHFVPDKKTPEDAGLIAFIAGQTGKLKSLASSDLEDYLDIGKQLLNVSKQFYIEGLGTLFLDDHNEYDFVQGNALIAASPAEEAHHKKYTFKKEERPDDISFEGGYQKRAKSTVNTLRRALIIFALVLGLTILGGVVYYFTREWQFNKSQPTNVLENIRPVIPEQKSANADSSASGADSLNTFLQTGNSYKVIIETSKRQRALSRYEEILKMGHDVHLSTTDSLTFKLYTIITGPLADTARSRDSISIFFGRPARIELE